jgi:predicted Fe-Mo cluster-binding NifX family protein
MRIVVSADNRNGLDSVVSPHFGRCPHFVLIDVDGREVEGVQEVDNPYYSQHQPGQVPGFIHSLGAEVMLTGGMGGRAITFFREYGIQGVTGAYGTVGQSLERYLNGQLDGATPCKESQEHGHGDVPTEGAYERDAQGRLHDEADMLLQQLKEVEDRLSRMSGGGRHG